MPFFRAALESKYVAASPISLLGEEHVKIGGSNNFYIGNAHLRVTGQDKVIQEQTNTAEAA